MTEIGMSEQEKKETFLAGVEDGTPIPKVMSVLLIDHATYDRWLAEDEDFRNKLNELLT